MRIVHGVLAALFALCALLQYNDPDPLRWALLYACAASAAGLAAVGRPQRLLSSALAGACLAWMSFLADGMAAFVRRGDWSLLAATMKAGEPMIEESREFLGLAIVLAWCLLALLEGQSPFAPMRKR
jgi:hypothetical protein